jgi:hypothetical protein
VQIPAVHFRFLSFCSVSPLLALHMTSLRPKAAPVADVAKRRPAAAGAAGDAGVGVGASGGGGAQPPPAADSSPQGPPVPVPVAVKAHVPHLVTRDELEALVQEVLPWQSTPDGLESHP